MSFVRFLSFRITFYRGAVFAKVSVLLAWVSLVLGVAVMDIAISVTHGFESAIESKITGFVSQIQVTSYLASANDTIVPLRFGPEQFATLQRAAGSEYAVSPFLYRRGLLKSKHGMEGVELKGVGSKWNAQFFQRHLVQGRIPSFRDTTYSTELLISKKLADMLLLQVGEKARVYFMERGKVRVRVVSVAGVYETGLFDFDQMFVLCDIRLLQRILGWSMEEVEGLELHSAQSVDNLQGAQALNYVLPHHMKAYPAQELFPELYNWLSLQHQHVFIIIVLMTLVAVINLASAIIILILERSAMIGILKALGANNWKIQRIFLGQAAWLIVTGIGTGTLLAWLLLWIQDSTGWVVLDQEAYFVKEVPVQWTWGAYASISGIMTGIGVVAMFLPTLVAKRITPIQILRFRG